MLNLRKIEAEDGGPKPGSLLNMFYVLKGFK